MTTHGADPAFFGQNHRHRLTFHHGEVDILDITLSGFSEAGAAAAKIGVRAKGFVNFADLLGDALPLQIV